MANPDGDLSSYLSTLSPEALIGRYQYIAAGGTERRDKELYGQQDYANQFAYDLAKKTLAREPTPAEIVSGPGFITASGVGQILAGQTVTTAPPSQSADNMDSAASGVFAPATSTPGGTSTAYASQYSFGSAPTTFAALPSDNSSLILMGLVGAVIFYFTVLKHG